MQVVPEGPFTAYEARVIGEIAAHMASPGPVRVALDRAGWPVERLLMGAAITLSEVAPLHLPEDAAGAHGEADTDLYLATKAEVVAAIRRAGQYLAGLTEKGMPALVRAVIWAAERIGVSVGEKELAALVPVVGAGLNAAVNVAFQQVGHENARDYFRRQVLARRYGAEAVDAAIGEARRRLAARPLPQRSGEQD